VRSGKKTQGSTESGSLGIRGTFKPDLFFGVHRDVGRWQLHGTLLFPSLKMNMVVSGWLLGKGDNGYLARWGDTFCFLCLKPNHGSTHP
jgi:hypothetical protein